MEAQMLKDKVAIITGASYGMGRSMAELFAEEGAAVVITARHQEKLDAVVESIRQKGGKAVGVVADVCSTEDTKRVFKTALKKFGDVDILINNAGISSRETLAETTPESWEKTIATNQTGVYYGMQLCIAAMAENGEAGAVVSTASIDGVVGDADFFSYCATKAAVQAMTRCAALYCGQKGLNIRVNAVAPGYILTPMAEEDARQNGQSIEEYCREFIALHPIGRLGTPEEVAKAYLYLACADSAFVTGTTLMVDGGYTAQ